MKSAHHRNGGLGSGIPAITIDDFPGYERVWRSLPDEAVGPLRHGEARDIPLAAG